MPRELQRDQTQRKQTNDSLRLEREKADLAFKEWFGSINASADAVIVRARARAQDVITHARRQADEVLARETASMEPSASGERAAADRVLREEQREADSTLRAARDDQVARSTSERQVTDSSLRSERIHSDEVLATRDEVLGVVSHELRNMLNAMIGFAELLEIGLEGGTRSAPHMVTQAQHIQRSGERMARLLGDLVDVASIESGVLTMSPEVSDPMTVIEEAVEAFQEQASSRGFTLTSFVVEPSTHATFDPARVLQVLVNLLSNAFKFTRAGGRIAVRAERIGHEVRIAVSDTGSGIPTERLEKVFERFWQATQNDRRGVGLGLYISKRIVLAHGGRIWAESQPDEGSTFFFTLPIATAAL